MTLMRVTALEKMYKSEIEDRQDVEPLAEEVELKILIFNLCREIIQIFIAFGGSAEFGTVSH